MKRELEGQKSFPYIAWTAIIGFALLVSFLSHLLLKQGKQLDAKRTTTEAALEKNLRHDDFTY